MRLFIEMLPHLKHGLVLFPFYFFYFFYFFGFIATPNDPSVLKYEKSN